MRVTARVRNAGRAAAPATVARLYDGDPGVVALARRGAGAGARSRRGGGRRVRLPDAGSAGARTLYVVADAAGQVRESREDDNTASRALTVEGLLADLEVLPADIVVAPVRARGRRERPSIAVTVRNRGERASLACALRVSVTDPSGASVCRLPAALPALGRGSPRRSRSAGRPRGAAPHRAGDRRRPLRGAGVGRDERRDGADGERRRPGARGRGPRRRGVPSSRPTRSRELPQAVEVRRSWRTRAAPPSSSTVAVFDERRGRDEARLGSPSRSTRARAARSRSPGHGDDAGPAAARASWPIPTTRSPRPTRATTSPASALADARTLDLEL